MQKTASSSLSFFLSHGIMDTPEAHRDMLTLLPTEPKELVKLVQNALIHQHMAEWVYGVVLDEDFESFRQFVESHDKIRVPEDWRLVRNWWATT